MDQTLIFRHQVAKLLEVRGFLVGLGKQERGNFMSATQFLRSAMATLGPGITYSGGDRALEDVEHMDSQPGVPKLFQEGDALE